MNYLFSKNWFKSKQRILLWLLNTPIIKLWFRFVLRINGKRSSVGKNKIIGILPNAIFWQDKNKISENKYVGEFRSHNKFVKRLYYAFYPFWYLLHCWDILFANNFKPAWNLGFDTLTVYPDPDPEINTVDGPIYRYAATGESWVAIRAGAGNDARPSSANEPHWYIACGADANIYTYLGRSIFLFDTSALTSSAIISNAVISLYGTAKVNNIVLSEANAMLWIVTSTPASNTDLVVGDYQQTGLIKQHDSGLTYAAFLTTGYNDITFNATGIGNISKTGISKFGCRLGADFSDTQPEWVSNAASYVWGYLADQLGTSQDPKLVITYSLASGGAKFNSNLSMLNVG